MVLPILFLIISGILLLTGTMLVIREIIRYSNNRNIAPLLSTLTMIALTCSIPVLFVSLNASLRSHSHIVAGNIIGGNLFGIGIILGISAIISPIKIYSQLLKANILLFIAATILFILLFHDRQISRFEGSILLSGALIYLFINLKLSKIKGWITIPNREPTATKPQKQTKLYLILPAGFSLISAGSILAFKGTIELSNFTKIAETIIGFTILSLITSLPTLLAAVSAFKKQEHEIGLSIVIGTGVFNILAISGIASIVNPVTAISISNIDLGILFGSTLLLIPLFRSRYELKRDEGLFFIGMYIIYLYYFWPK